MGKHATYGEKTFAQIYIHDPDFNEDEELDRRMAVSDNGKTRLNKKIMRTLQELLHQVNHFVKDLKYMMDLPDENVKDLKFVLKARIGSRVYLAYLE